MRHQDAEAAASVATFGRRKVRPRACVADGKDHIRTFLIESLEELGFVTCECRHAAELGAVVDGQRPDLIVLGLSAGAIEAGEMLKTLAARTFDGKVLLLGPPACPAMAAIQELAENLEIAMLPKLDTPFGEGGLRNSVAMLIPVENAPDPPIHVDEAMSSGWLELWYQPEIDARTLAVKRAEALIRIRHPTWGVVPAAYFIPDDGDPQFRALSEFVIRRAVDDWRYFVAQHGGGIDIAINLPIAFLRDPESVKSLCRQMPDHPAFDGMTIEINGTEVVRNLELAKELARQLRFHNIAIAIDDLGAEWPQLAGLADFPFAEIKVDRKFVTGCAADRLKQTVCHRILDLADGYGARTVAEGVETQADFLTVREMGFDKVQGFFLGKPATAKKFARSMLGRPVSLAK
jgi:EAL domain-containing protein (putative c-di-GMP-specific phosphodiesterase class I)/CheY-like chemotaxis protein